MSRRLTDAARELFRALDLDPNRHPLEVAERCIESAKIEHANERNALGALFWLTQAVENQQRHLRASTAPGRTEAPGCAMCPEAAAEARRAGIKVKCYGCSNYILPPEAEGSEGPSDEELEAARRYNPEDLEPLGSLAFVHCGSPLKRWSQITQEERRAWMQAAGFAFRAGRSSAARELQGKSRAVVHEAQRSHDALTEADRELAELREKVKAWEPVVEAVGLATGTSDATILAMALGQFDAIPTHLRPGSEGKATT